MWLDEARNYPKQNPLLRLLSLSADTLSTEDRYRYHFAIRQAKIRIRLDQLINPKDELIDLPSFSRYGPSYPLPGGNAALWVAKYTGTIEPYRTDPQVHSRYEEPFQIGWMNSMEWSVECLIKTTSPLHNLLRENGIGNLAADRQIHYTDNTGARRVSFVAAGDHRGVAPPVVSHTCRGETFITDFHGQERPACFFPDREGNLRCCFITVTIHLDYDSQWIVNLRSSRPLSEPNQLVQYGIYPVQACWPSPTRVRPGLTDFQSSRIRNTHCSWGRANLYPERPIQARQRDAPRKHRVQFHRSGVCVWPILSTRVKFPSPRFGDPGLYSTPSRPTDPSSIISRASSDSSATQTGSHPLQDESDATKQDLGASIDGYGAGEGEQSPEVLRAHRDIDLRGMQLCIRHGTCGMRRRPSKYSPRDTHNGRSGEEEGGLRNHTSGY